MASPTRALAAAALAAATLAAGCGDASERYEEGARATAEAYVDACAHEHYTAALELLSVPARERFLAAGSGAAGCRAVLEPTEEALPIETPEEELRTLLDGMRVVGVRVHGDEAVADIAIPGEPDATANLHSFGPHWSIYSPAS